MPEATDGQAQRSEPNRLLGFVQAALILAAIVVALYFARAPSYVQVDSASDLSFEIANPVVHVVNPVPVQQSMTLNLTGSVTLEEKAVVVSEVMGRVTWISPDFNNGGVIPANEAFVQIDRTEYELEVEAAGHALAEAEARLQIAQSEGIAFGVALAEAGVARAQTALELAELQLERTSISLPYEIRVMATELEVGEVVGSFQEVGPASRMGVVYRVDALQFEAPIEVSSLAFLEPIVGRSASIRTEAGTHRLVAERVSSVVAPRSRLAKVFFRFSPDQTIASLPLPGSFGEGEVEGPSFENVYVLPEAAVQEENRVWIVADGALTSLTPTALGRADGGLIVEAFDTGEGVVLGTLPEAREGLAVTVAKAGPSE